MQFLQQVYQRSITATIHLAAVSLGATHSRTFQKRLFTALNVSLMMQINELESSNEKAASNLCARSLQDLNASGDHNPLIHVLL